MRAIRTHLIDLLAIAALFALAIATVAYVGVRLTT